MEMLREYEGYFALRYRQLERSSYFRFSDELFDRIPRRWRSDARYFLAKNVIDMILEPYDEIGKEPRGPDRSEEISELVLRDVDDLVRHSEQISKERGRRYVSATSVAIALGRLAPELKTTSLQIWGPADERPE